MNLMKFVKRMGNMTHQNERSAMMDVLESRSLLSASPVELSSVETSAITGFATLAATKQSVTVLKIAATSTVGDAVTISSAVLPKSGTGVPTGTVTFLLKGALQGSTQSNLVIGSATLNAQGVAKISYTGFTAVGSAQVFAEYSGSGKYQFSQSAVATHTTTLAPTTAKLSITTPTSTLLGNGTGMLARIGSASGGAMPTGRVAFYDGSTLLGSKALDSAGHARWLANYLYTGTHDLKAIYLGDTTYLGHRSPVRSVDVSLPSMTTTSDGLQVGVVTAGAGGSVAGQGDTITANYTLYVGGVKNQSSLDSGTPFSFVLDANPEQVIAGFDEGLAGVTAGEKRVLIVPPSLGYGNQVVGNIPANSTLVFVVDIVSVTQGS